MDDDETLGASNIRPLPWERRTTSGGYTSPRELSGSKEEEPRTEMAIIQFPTTTSYVAPTPTAEDLAIQILRTKVCPCCAQPLRQE